jgi:hypothetical protein
VFPKAKKLLEGNVNPPVSQQLSMEDQIEAQPYDKRWEFPKHRLTLGLLFFKFLNKKKKLMNN